MPARIPDVVPKQAEEVLRYFLHNPRAADDIEGVARWRLPQVAVSRSVDETDEALRWLVAEGFLLEESVPGASPIFRFNRQKAAEAARFLAERKAAGPQDDEE